MSHPAHFRRPGTAAHRAPCAPTLRAGIVLTATLLTTSLLAAGARTADAQTLQEVRLVPRAEAPRLTVFADGNVRDVIGGVKGATPTSGSLGMTYQGREFIVTGLINVLGRIDTVRNTYGATMLPPAAGSAFNSGLLDIRRPYTPFGARARCTPNARRLACRTGAHGYLSVATARWATEIDATDTVRAVADVPVWGSGLGLYYSFFDGQVGGDTAEQASTASMLLDVGLATRHVRGDLTGHADRQAALLGTDRRNFLGLEVGLGLRYNEVNAGLTYYYMPGRVDGFSRGQVVAGVALRARLNAGRLRDREEPNDAGT